jgi:predicted secreted protein
MGAIAGKGGTATWATKAIAEITEWSLEISVDMLEITSLGDNWKEYISGLREWTGSITCKFNQADTDGQEMMRTALLGGTSAAVTLDVDSTYKFSGTVFLNGGSVNVTTGDAVEMSFNVTGSGALSYT